MGFLLTPHIVFSVDTIFRLEMVSHGG